jgi:hypothetical protein
LHNKTLNQLVFHETALDIDGVRERSLGQSVFSSAIPGDLRLSLDWEDDTEQVDSVQDEEAGEEAKDISAQQTVNRL